VTDYVIESSTDPASGWAPVPDGPSTATSYTVTGLANGTLYWFRVSAVNPVGTSAPSDLASARPSAVPSAPQTLTAAPTNVSGQVRLSWLLPASDGGAAVSDYAVQRSLTGSTGWVTIADGVSTATTFTATGFTNGRRYWFRVIAVNAAGASAPSNVADAIPRTVPLAPRSLTANPTNVSGQIRLSWLAPASNGGAAVSDYAVQRSLTGTTGWVTIADGVSTATTFTATGFSNGRRYWFRVIAVNAAGASVPSNVGNAVPRTLPSAARSLTAGLGGTGRLVLTWLAPASTGGAPVSYVIQRSLSGTSGWVTIDQVQATTYTVTGLSNGRRYWFRVIAFNAAGSGPVSNVAHQVPLPVPTVPLSLAATPNNRSGQVKLTWFAPGSNGGFPITDYVIQSSTTGTSGWVTIADGVSTATSYIVTGLGNGHRYWFRVYARNSVGAGPVSNATSAVPRTVPSAPRSLTATPTNQSGEIRLVWQASPSANGSPITAYLIQVSTNGTSSWWTSAVVSGATTYTMNVITNGVRLWFRVVARNAAGDSLPSNTVSAVARTVPGAPRNLVADATFEGYTLDWDAPASRGASITDYVVAIWEPDYHGPGVGDWVIYPDGVSTMTSARIARSGYGCDDIAVVAINAAGAGEAAVVTSCFLP
jgi:titin